MKAAEIGHKLLESKTGHLSVFLAMYLLLVVEYRRFVYYYYNYMLGFDFLAAPVPILVGLFFLATLVCVMFLLPRKDSGSYTVSMIVAVLFCLPAIVMYQVGRVSIYVPTYTLLFLILLRTPLLEMKQWKLPRIPVRMQRFVLPAVCLLCLLPFPLAYGLDLDLSRFAMGEHTYEVRAEVLTKNNLLTAYLMGPLRVVLLPMLIVYGLIDLKRNWWMTLLGIAGMLLLFMLNPQKSIFFSIAVVLAFFLFKSHYAKAGMFLYLMMAACLVAVLLNVVKGSLVAESMVLRRLLFIPVIVCDNYFTFFDGHPMYLSHSFLRHWTEYPYQVDPSHMIGSMMYNRTITNCNTGIVGDGFMNFGHLGALLFVAIGALFVRCVEAQMPNARFFGLLALLVFTFLNSALFTTLLTHGGLVLLVAGCFLIPPSRQAERC